MGTCFYVPLKARSRSIATPRFRVSSIVVSCNNLSYVLNLNCFSFNPKILTSVCFYSTEESYGTSMT